MQGVKYAAIQREEMDWNAFDFAYRYQARDLRSLECGVLLPS